VVLHNLDSAVFFSIRFIYWRTLMKLFRILPLVVGSAAAGILVSTSPAHALNFTFTFTGSDSNTVSGTIYGLQDNATSAASDVVATSTSNPNLQTYLGSYINNLDSRGVNSGTVAGGVLTAFTFFSNRINNGGTGEYLLLGNNSYSYNYLGNGNSLATYNTGGFAGINNPSASATVPFDIPGGATIPALGSLLALGGMRKVRKSIASKTRIANFVTATVS